MAVGDRSLRPVIELQNLKALVQDDRLGDDLPFGSRGGALIRHSFPLDAEYTIKVLLRRRVTTSSAWASGTISTSGSMARCSNGFPSAVRRRA